MKLPDLRWLLWDRPSTNCLCAQPRESQPLTKLDEVLYRLGLFLLIGVLFLILYWAYAGFWNFREREMRLMERCLIEKHPYSECHWAYLN